jgi:hypothetical protein
MKITWTHDDQEIPWPPSFEEKVEIFYHRLLGWQLHVADLVSNGGEALAHGDHVSTVPSIPHSGFAVLQICLSYFETIAQYQRVNPNTTLSGDFFREGVHAIFPELGQAEQAQIDAFLDILYKNARCGLYHSSMTRGGVGLGQPGNNIAMAFNSTRKQLVIDPHVLPRALKEHLESYRKQLLDPRSGNIRDTFEKQFNKDNGL